MDSQTSLFLIIVRLWLLGLLLSGSVMALADVVSDHRVLVGLNLFRTFVAADRELQRHRQDDGRLPVVVLYAHSLTGVAAYQERLSQTFPMVKNMPTHITAASLEAVVESAATPAAVFVAEKLAPDERQRLVNLSIQKRFLVFSPFEGDVEAGVLGGLAVEARVTPIVNMNTLATSHIPLKRFYLSVSRRYEE